MKCINCGFYIYGSMECTNPKIRPDKDTDDLEVDPEGDELVYWMSEGRIAGVNMAQNFGCIHFVGRN